MEIIETFQAGEIVIKEGSKGSSAYVILSGTAIVMKRIGSTDIAVATLGEGQVFGEMGLIEDRPRSASVKAESVLKTRVIDRDRFNKLLKDNPSVLIPIMKSLFERLRQASELLAERTFESDAKVEEEKVFEIYMEGRTEEAREALGGRVLNITRFPFLIGRHAARNPDSDVFTYNDLSIEEERPYVVSRNHLAIHHERGMLWVVDRGSAFGAIVNGVEIGGNSGKARAPLDKEENQVIIGPVTSKFIFLLKVETR